MALQTLLQIVTRSCDELGLVRPGVSGVYASSLPQDRQMLALLNAAGRDLMTDHDWTALIATASVATEVDVGTYTMPTDFDRLLEGAGWDRTNDFPMTGSITPGRHQYWLSSAVVGPTTRKEYKLFTQPGSSTFTVHPTPTAVEDLNFLYIRNSWAYSGSSYVSEFAADTDTTVFEPQLLVKELKWRFRSMKGLDAADLIFECDNYKRKLIGADNAPPALDMTGGYQNDEFFNIPEGNWPTS